MKKYFIPLGDLKYQMCHPVGTSGFDEIHEFLLGISASDKSNKVQMELVNEDLGRPLKISDSPWLGSYTLILRPRTLDVMKDYIYKYGRIVPFKVKDDDFFFWVVTNVKDALNKEESDIFYVGKDKRIGAIERYKLKESVLGEDDVFRLKDDDYGEIYVSENFVSDWKKAKLKGLEFDPIPLA